MTDGRLDGDGPALTPAAADERPAPTESEGRDPDRSDLCEIAPQPAPRRSTRWPRGATPLLALAVIGLAIWYLQWGPGFALPGSSGGDGAAGAGAAANGGFVSFASQGVKLGAGGSTAPRLDRPAPDFTLLDLDGNPVTLSDLRGSTVVMNFWATWCPPCRKEFPELVRLDRLNRSRGLVVLGVDLQENAGIVRRFADEFGAAFPIVIDAKGDVGGQYRLLGLPTTYFIDAEGILRAQQVGVLTEEILATKLADAKFIVAKGQ